jgi:hypothetical protein
MGAMQRNKGNRVEREIVNWHKDIGIPAERVPLSGASRYQGEGHDLNVYPWGEEQEPLVCEVKARKDGAGSTLLRRWLADYDALFLHEDREDDLVVVPCRVWAELLDAVRSTNTRRKPKNRPVAATFAKPASPAHERGENNEHSAKT